MPLTRKQQLGKKRRIATQKLIGRTLVGFIDTTIREAASLGDTAVGMLETGKRRKR